MQTLTKPASGWIALEMDGSPVKLDFDGGGATLQKDGENLVFKFDDGSSSVLQGFYQHGKDAKFIVDGQEIPAEALFEAMNASDIMPAAGGEGQGAQAAPQNHHGASYDNADILGGTWSLRELDINFDSAGRTTDTYQTFADYVAGNDQDSGADSETVPQPAPVPEPTPIPEPEPVPEPEPYTANAALDVPSVFEGQPIVGKIALDNPPTEDCTVQIKVGGAVIDVPVPAGANEAEFTVDNPNGEDPFLDASSVEAEIVSITGGGYDSTNAEKPSTIDILDTIDKVSFSISGEAVDETAETVAFTITSDDPVQTGTLAVVVNVDGNEYSVPMEWTESGWMGRLNVPVRENDLLINGKDTIDAYVARAKHDAYEWENPDYGKKTEATVVDNVDDAVFNTAIAVEDGQYVVEVTSAQPNSADGHPSVTLTVNGENQRLELHWDEARDLWTASAAFDLPAPTHSDETVHVEASVSNPSMKGLEYENPICNPAVKDIVVEHEWWPVNASLDIPPAFEGSDIVGRIVLDNLPFEDCTATIKVGDVEIEVPIPANATEVEFTVENPNGEDPFIDASTVQAEIVSIEGGGYDSREYQEPVTVNILDTIDEVKFAITGQNVDETAETTVFTITSDDPVQTGTLSVTVDVDGTEYTVPMEWTESGWSGTLEVPVRENDLLINGKDTMSAQVVFARHDSYEWENPDYGKATEATVIDNVDDAVFNTAITVENGQYIVEVTSAQPNSNEGHPSLTLTVNGESQQIDLHWDDAREMWVESVAFDLPAPTHSDEIVHVEASISNPSMLGLEYENPICNPAVKDIVVEHEYWPVNASLDIPSVFEGSDIVGKIVLDNAPFEDCTATIKVGDTEIEVPVPAGSMEVEFTVKNPNGEDPFIDASSIEAEIVSINGGGYDETNLDNPINVDILDTIDEVKFSITGEHLDETAETAAFTITSDDPVQTGSLTVVASIGGKEYSVEMELADGSWIGHIDVPVRENDLLINGKDTIEAHIVSAKHDNYEWENPNYGGKSEATVIDNVDDAVFNTAITVEDGQYVVEVTSAQPNSDEGHPTLTLTVNGENRQIDLHWDDAREVWTESVAFDLPAPTHSDETFHVEASISDPSMLGLEYENPICNPAVKDIVVEHEPWLVDAHLEIPSVFEGSEIAGKVVLDNAPFNDDCIAVVKVGDATIEVPIPANALEAAFFAPNPNGEDPFIDASSVQANIESINGGGYDSVSFEDPITVSILDTIDEVKFAITGEAVDETAATATFTITSDDPVQTGSLTVVASIDGTEHSVEMQLVDGAWIGQVEVPVRENDLLINGKDTIEAHIVSARHDNYEWENPNYGKAAEATVIDNVDDAVFNTAISVVDGQYVVEVTSAQPYSADGHPILTLTVNGESQQIDLHWDDAREMWVESVSFDLPAPTHSDETVHIEASISDPSMKGLEYENPILNSATKDIVVEHEYWPVNAHLEVPSVFEGSEIAGKVILDNAPVDDCIATVKIGNALVEVPVEAGKTEASFTIDNPNTEDPFIDASSIQAEIVSIDGGRYDEVNLEDPITVNILDTIDKVTFSITGQNVDETAETTVFTITSDDPVQTGSLTVTASIDGKEYTVPMHWTESGWTGQMEVPVRDNDLLINGKDTIEAYVVSARHDSYEWENPDYGKAAEATVVDNVDDAVFNTSITVNETAYVVEVTSVQPNSTEGHPILTLTVNGESQQIDLHWDDARELWTESVSFDLPARGINDETLHVEASISDPSMKGLEYENPILNSTETDIFIEHEPYNVNAHLEIPSVFEGNDIVGAIVLDNPPREDCIAVVKVGDNEIEVPIPADAQEIEFTVDNPNGEDPFIDASFVNAEIVSIEGGGYDERTFDDPVRVDILDTIDEVKFAITGQHVDETAETTVFTITSDDPVQTGSLSVIASIDGVEYAVQMEWTEGGWIGHVEVPVRENDLLINGKDTIEAHIVSAQHDSHEWENPDYGNATEATVIDNVDDAVFNTSISVEEDQYIVEVTSVQPYSEDGCPTVTLTVNGESQQIDLHWDEARELWTESVSYPLPSLTDVPVHLNASVSNPSMLGLEYENPICNSTSTVIVPEPFSGDPLMMTVDESYIPSGSKHGKGDGYLDSAYLGAPESGADAEYSLSFASAATEIVAVVDGLERGVFLQMQDDGSVVGRVQVNAIKTADVFSVSIDETGHVSLELTGNASMLHLASRNEGEEIVFSGISARMESEGETAERPIEMHFKDDAPYLLEDSEDRVARIVPTESQADNLLDCGPAMDFTMGSSGARFKNGTSGVQHWAAEGVTLSAAIVKFDGTGRYAVEVAPPVDSLEGKTHYLAYSGHNSNQAKPWNWGLNVKSSSKWEHWAEISYDIQEKESQAVVFDLGGKLAYGITVEFGACYDPTSSVMANDRQFPEAALVVFFRDGEMVGQEIASGLSTGMESRTFGAAVAGGFDKAVVSSLDNDSIDPKPRNQYQHVSDNEFTIRSVDFAVHPRMEPVHSVEGDLLLESGADGMAIAQKAVMFDVDAMGMSFDAVFADGNVHTVTLQPEAGGTCLNAVAEDGSIVFNAVVGSDGIWNANIYQTFTKVGSDVDGDGTSWLSLAFKTGEDADGDYASATMLMPTQWVDDALPVAVNVEIEAVDHTVAADATLVHADIDETMLGEGSSVEISVNGQSHVLNWNGSGFDPVEGFDFAWHQGSISWVEEMPPAGQMLEVTVVQRWIDGTGNEMAAYGEDNAQRELDVYGKEVHSDEPVPTLQDWLDSQPVDDLIADLTGSAGLPSSPSGEHPDLSASAPLTSSTTDQMDVQDYAATASSTELDSIVMTMQTSAG